MVDHAIRRGLCNAVLQAATAESDGPCWHRTWVQTGACDDSNARHSPKLQLELHLWPCRGRPATTTRIRQEHAKDPSSGPLYVRVVNTTAVHRDRRTNGEHNMNTSHNFKKMIVGALLSGGVALAGFGLTAGTAQAAPDRPGPTIDHSDFGVPVVECVRCGGHGLPGGLDINPGVNPAGKLPSAVQGIS